MIDLDELVRLHERPLHNFALQLTRSEDDADDLVQETWIKCLLHQVTLAGLTEQKQRSWMFTVLKNRWLDICRHRKLERLLNPRVEQPQLAITPVYKLDQQLDKLPALEQKIVRLRFWNEMNSRQIAEELEMPEGTVRWRLKAALDKLRLYIEKEDKEERCQP